MEEKYGYRGGQHRLVIENRERTEITGVVHVDSFDDEEVIMETELGLLAVRGENLHIKHLNLDQGEISIEGYILELAYAEEKHPRARGKNLLERLFK
ncbi:MAG: sporulation protein YabP [Firmicutes bacterium]|jgi:sporulation protein YabP|nr:sporulation protein YabP [Bacillota bacterium]HPU00738.1 sporulation protein YabP [Bacillota bacterium]